MEREVTVEDKKYRIKIGFGVYNRIDALSVIIRATSPEFQQTIVAQSDAPMTEDERVSVVKDNLTIGTNILKSEEILTSEEAEKISNVTFDNTRLIDLLEIEQTLGEKVGEAKMRILEIAVRDSADRYLTQEFIESGLSPSAGSKLFALVMETFDLVKKDVEDKKNAKN